MFEIERVSSRWRLLYDPFDFFYFCIHQCITRPYSVRSLVVFSIKYLHVKFDLFFSLSNIFFKQE